MNTQRLWTFFLILVGFVSGLVMVPSSQEKPARPTRSWRAYELPMVDWRTGGVLVDVIDTESVCLYVARANVPADMAVAITAVPKTQLPAGTGCQ